MVSNNDRETLSACHFNGLAGQLLNVSSLSTVTVTTFTEVTDYKSDYRSDYRSD